MLQQMAARVLGVDCNKIVCRVKRLGELSWSLFFEYGALLNSLKYRSYGEIIQSINQVAQSINQSIFIWIRQNPIHTNIVVYNTV